MRRPTPRRAPGGRTPRSSRASRPRPPVATTAASRIRCAPGRSSRASVTGSPGTSRTSRYYLSPQWTRVASGWAPASPTIYRQLLNAFYRAVKRVSPSNFVVTAGTAPYGDRARWPADAPGRVRSRPVLSARRRAPGTGELPGPAASGRALAPPLRHRRPALARLEPGRCCRARRVQDRAGLARRRARGPRATRRAQAAVGHGDLLGQLAAGPGRGPDPRAGALARASAVRTVAPGRGYRAVAADRRLAADPELRQHVSGRPVLPWRRTQAGGPGFPLSVCHPALARDPDSGVGTLARRREGGDRAASRDTLGAPTPAVSAV